jgi:hypothetical protein
MEALSTSAARMLAQRKWDFRAGCLELLSFTLAGEPNMSLPSGTRGRRDNFFIMIEAEIHQFRLR